MDEDQDGLVSIKKMWEIIIELSHSLSHNGRPVSLFHKILNIILL